MKFTTDLDFGELGEQAVEVSGEWHSALPGTEDSPPEPEGFELVSVTWRGLDITDDLSDYAKDTICERAREEE